jgi:hypothetical protein
MSQTIWKDRKIILFSFVAAGTTVIAGIFHLTMVSQSLSHDMGRGILFLVGGVLQIFWAVPVIRQWGRIWQIIGIAGTAILVILFFLSILHLMPEVNILGGVSKGNMHPEDLPRGNMTGGEFPRGPPSGGRGIGFGGFIPPIEMFQIAFIGLYAVLGKLIFNKQK